MEVGGILLSNLPAVAILLTEVTCSHTRAGMVARLSWVQAGGIVVAVVGLAFQFGLYLAMMVGPCPEGREENDHKRKDSCWLKTCLLSPDKVKATRASHSHELQRDKLLPHVSLLLLPAKLLSLCRVSMLLQQFCRHCSPVFVHLTTRLAANHLSHCTVVVPKHRMKHAEVGDFCSCPAIRQFRLDFSFRLIFFHLAFSTGTSNW